MKAVILAGGLGTRISEETGSKPKPMIEIGGKPILWHIMKIYSSHGINDFVICCGFKGYLIKEFFSNYFIHTSDITIDLNNNSVEIHNRKAEPWKVTLVDTGELTMTGGRIKRIKDHIDGTFCLTYGDGLADIDITMLIEFHQKSEALCTLTAVQPLGRFGSLEISGDRVSSFIEKPQGDGGWINGGFFVCSNKILNYIDNDETIWERGPLERISSQGALSAYKHLGFWQPMDTLRDKMLLEELWSKGTAPWKKNW